MNVTLIGSISDTKSRMVHQWFVSNDIPTEHVEEDAIPTELIDAGATTLPIVLVNGKLYCCGYDPTKLELLTHR